jgi:hypothetical protein
MKSDSMDISGIVTIGSTAYTEMAIYNKKRSLFASVIEVAPSKDIKRTDVVLVVDRSGSMEDSMKSVRALLLATYDLLATRGNITVIAFDEINEVIYSSAMEKRKEDPGLDRSQYDTAIERLDAGGCTNISSALERAFTFQGEGQTLIICISDGEPNAGFSSKGDFINLVETKKKYNTLINTVGLGMSYDTQILSAIGQMTHISDMELAPGVIGSMIGLFSSSVGYEATLELYDEDTKSIMLTYDVGILYAEQQFKAVTRIIPRDSNEYIGKAMTLVYKDSHGVRINVSTVVRRGENIPDDIKLVYYEKQAAYILVRLSESKRNARMYSNRVSKWPKLAESFTNKVLDACVQRVSRYDAAQFQSSCDYQVGYGNGGMQTSAQKRDCDNLGVFTSGYLESIR